MALGDASSLCDRSDDDESEVDSDDEAWYKYLDSNETRGEVVRKNGRITIEFEW